MEIITAREVPIPLQAPLGSSLNGYGEESFIGRSWEGGILTPAWGQNGAPPEMEGTGEA